MRKPALPHPGFSEPSHQPSHPATVTSEPSPGPVHRASEPIELAPSEAAGQQVALAGMAAGRRAVLGRLKTAGEATADQLAADLAITVGRCASSSARSATPG